MLLVSFIDGISIYDLQKTCKSRLDPGKIETKLKWIGCVSILDKLVSWISIRFDKIWHEWQFWRVKFHLMIKKVSLSIQNLNLN